MGPSVVQICNLALLKFGNITVDQIDVPTNKEERACKVFYPLMRDELLFTHPWNFAMARADISAQLATTPPFGFDYAYTLPADCLRVWELQSGAEFEVEGRELLVNQEEEIYIRYIRQVTESGRFTPSFVNCLAVRMAAELAAKLADDKQLRLSLLEELHKIALPAALQLNAMEGNKPRHKDAQGIDKGNFAWQTEGR